MGIKGKLRHLLTTIQSITIKFFKDSCLVRASGLAYSTLLAMVPFLTVIYAFGGFDTLGKTIESALLKAILPSHHEAILEVINSFTRNSLTTGAVGMIFFLVTSIFLINTVARNFDSIWGIEAKPGILRRYATYTAILVFGSLILGVSTSFADTIEQLIQTDGIQDVTEYRAWFAKLLPYFLTVAVLFFMMIIIPSTKVKIIPGVTGAIVAWVLFEGVKILFKYWLANSVRVSLIYGSIAIIPIFLIGLYLFWLIVLIGVEVSYYLQHEKDFKGLSPENLTLEESISIALELFLHIGTAYIRGEEITTRESLEKHFQFSPRVIDSIITKLIDNALLLEISNKHKGFIPGRSMDNIYIKDIIFAIHGDGTRLNFDSITSKNSQDFIIGGLKTIDSKPVLDILKGEGNA